MPSRRHRRSVLTEAPVRVEASSMGNAIAITSLQWPRPVEIYLAKIVALGTDALILIPDQLRVQLSYATRMQRESLHVGGLACIAVARRVSDIGAGVRVCGWGENNWGEGQHKKSRSHPPPPRWRPCGL